MTGTTGAPCRPVTADEVEHLGELGWVQLKAFIDPDRARSVLELARQAMGDDADANPIPPGFEAAAKAGEFGLDYFNAHLSFGTSNPVLEPLLRDAGQAARVLQGRRAPDGGTLGVRYYSDFFAPKLPSAQRSLHRGNGPTAFHQDFITFAVDRSGGLTFWFPLEAYGPETGTMSFVNASHRYGVLGDYTTYGDKDALGVFSELNDLEVSAPLTYELGDVSVHTHLTVHGAGANLTNQPRWAYLIVTQPADACWNGSPCPNFSSKRMTQWQPLGDERFPLIG